MKYSNQNNSRRIIDRGKVQIKTLGSSQIRQGTQSPCGVWGEAQGLDLKRPHNAEKLFPLQATPNSLPFIE
jgi:hypothetical protein